MADRKFDNFIFEDYVNERTHTTHEQRMKQLHTICDRHRREHTEQQLSKLKKMERT